MKKIILTLSIIMSTISLANAQDLFVETKIELPAENDYIFGGGLTFGYYFDLADNLRIGPSIAADYYLADSESSASNALYIPLAVSTDFQFADNTSIGLDVGYSLGVSPSNAKGGFYYRPSIRYNIIQVSYSTISLGNGNNFSAFQIGLKMDSSQY